MGVCTVDGAIRSKSRSSSSSVDESSSWLEPSTEGAVEEEGKAVLYELYEWILLLG